MMLNAIIEKDEFGYFAQIPELKGCVTQGNTYEEVLLNIQETAELYLESLKIEELQMLQKRKIIISPIDSDCSCLNIQGLPQKKQRRYKSKSRTKNERLIR